MAEETYTEPTTLTARITTAMNSLADGSQATSSNLSNDGASEGYLFVNLTLVLAAPSTRTGDIVNIFLELSDDGGSTWSTIQELIAVISVPLDTSAVIAHARAIKLPDMDYRYVVENNTGVAFAASGNTLEEAKYNREIV